MKRYVIAAWLLLSATIASGQELRSIEGCVADALSGVPIANASVSCDGKPTFTTDSNGEFRGSIPANGALLFVEAPNYLPQIYKINDSYMIVLMQLTDEARQRAELIAAEARQRAELIAAEQARLKKLNRKVKHEVTRNTIVENIVGWRHSTYLTISGAGRYIEYPSLSVEYLGGYRFNNTFFVGAGTGILFHFKGNRNLVNIPLYANAKAYIGKSRLQPYFSLSVGGNFSTKRTYVGIFEVGTSQFFVTPGIGLDVRFKSGSAISLQAGLQLITTPTDHWIENVDKQIQYHISYPLKPGFQVQIGYTF